MGFDRPSRRRGRFKCAAALCTLITLAACTSVEPREPREPSSARSVLARVMASPLAEYAREEIADAEAAIVEAEREAEAHPGSARADDAAYVAQRMVERAAIAASYGADRDALVRARGTVERLAGIARYRADTAAAAARKALAEANARASIAAARRTAVDRARAAMRAEIAEPPEGLRFRFSAEAIFLSGTSLLRSGAERRLAALASVLRAGPPCDVRIDVLNDVAGVRSGALILAERRRVRIHDALRRHGVPSDAFIPPMRHPPSGTQVDVSLIERPVVLPVAAR